MQFGDYNRNILFMALAIAIQLTFPSITLSSTAVSPNAAAQAKFESAESKYKTNDLRGAVADLNSAIECDPKFLRAYYLRACCEHKSRDFDASINDCSKAIALDNKGVPNLYYQRGMSEFRAGMFDASIKDCDTALKLNPKFTLTYKFRAMAKAAKGDYKGAMADCNQLLAAFPNDQGAIEFKEELESQLTASSEDERTIAEGYIAEQTTPLTKIASGPQTFAFAGHKFQLTPPANSGLKQLPSPGGRTYSFQIQGRDKQSYDLSIMQDDSSDADGSVREVMAGLLDPFRKHLFMYSEHPFKPFVLNGRQFEGMCYSGNVAFIFPTKGLVFVTRVNKAFYVFIFNCDAGGYEQSRKAFYKFIESCKIYS